MSQNLLAIRHLERQQIEELLGIAEEMRAAVLDGKSLPDMKRYVVGLLFFEGSTRTRVSFERAANYLNLSTTNFSGAGSSMPKGETLKDTILTLRYERIDALVIRHSSSGSPYLAARFFGGPVLNAGDGQHEHPTQALGDALTIQQRKGQIRGLTVAIVGDVAHSRVARSNAWLLSKLGAHVRFVGPRSLIPAHTTMVPGEVHHDLASGLEGADVVMCLRLQKERMNSGLLSSVGEYARMYQINRETLRLASPTALVMHPGPLNRGIELDDIAADSEQSAITQQVENGVFVRMAALHWCMQGSPKSGAQVTGSGRPSKATSTKSRKAKQ